MKQSVLVLWVVLALCMMLASGWIASTARVVFWGMAAIHVVEFVIKRGVLERAGGSMAGHFLQTLIYGLFHWQPLEQQQARADGEVT